MALIDHTNFSTTLKQSTNPRGASPNGNVYFDVGNNLVDFITYEDGLTVLDLSAQGGSASAPNPLHDADGITMRAIYNFENSRRKVDETLRKYKRGTDGDYRFAGAYSFINGVKIAGAKRSLIRGSGFIEYAATGDGATVKDAIYHGVKSLVDIQPNTTSYYSLVANTAETTLQAATWTNFTRTGDIDEVVKVYTGGGIDNTASILVVRTRSWGYNAGETTSVASGITEFSGNSAGYGVGETLNPQNAYPQATVQSSAPFSTMTLTYFGTPQVKTGFVEGAGNFSWVFASGGATVQECTARLDLLAMTDADIDNGGGSYNGKKGRVWYTRNAEGKVVTSVGLIIEGLSTIEQQKIIQTTNESTPRNYPYFPSVEITFGANAVADVNAWYHVYYTTGFDSGSAITVQRAGDAAEMKGLCKDIPSGVLSFSYDYAGNTQGGFSGIRYCTVEVEGNGGVAQSLTEFTIKEQPLNTASCIPPVENNA